MADNVTLPGTGSLVATDQVTYSGDTAGVQLVRLVDVTGAEGSKVPVSPYALVSTANSSSTVLIASTSFTGTSEDVSDYSHVVVTVFTDVVSATDGLALQQSSNGTNWDFVDSYTVPASTGKTFSAAISAKFFRVVYTNGLTIQTAFRLQTIYSKQVKKGSSVRPQDGRSNENDFEEALAYGMGYNGSTWDRLLATLGKLNVLQPDITASGSLTAAAQTVSLALSGQSSGAVQITGTWVGTVTFEAMLDGSTWVPINAVSASTSTPQTTTTVNGLYRLTPGGVAQMRANMTAFTSGTAVVSLRASAGVGGTFANQLVPTKNTDGTSSQAIKAASTAAVAADQAAVVSLSPNSPIPTGTNIIGKTGIDQTTPGTTNLVALSAETTKVIGTVNIAAAQTLATVTTVAAVTAITNALPTGANVIGALSANQSVNNAQIGGVAVATGSGVTGTGVQRVVLATDLIQPAVSEIRAATLHVTATAAVNTAATCTLPAPAAGLFHYITSVELTKLYSVIGVAAGAGVIVTSTNLPGTPAWTTEQLASPAGTAPRVIDYNPTTPLKSAVAATATTFVAPLQLQTIWRWNVSYFTAA